MAFRTVPDIGARTIASAIKLHLIPLRLGRSHRGCLDLMRASAVSNAFCEMKFCLTSCALPGASVRPWPVALARIRASPCVRPTGPQVRGIELGDLLTRGNPVAFAHEDARTSADSFGANGRLRNGLHRSGQASSRTNVCGAVDTTSRGGELQRGLVFLLVARGIAFSSSAKDRCCGTPASTEPHEPHLVCLINQPPDA